MHNVAGDDIAARPDDESDACRSIVSDLVALIEHVQASLTRIEQVIARETSLSEADTAAGIVVLDDVTPRYLEASTALKACNAGLGVALGLLLDSGAVRRNLN